MTRLEAIKAALVEFMDADHCDDDGVVPVAIDHPCDFVGENLPWLIERIKELREANSALVRKLDMVHSSPYVGPQYVEELRAIRAALAKLDEPEGG